MSTEETINKTEKLDDKCLSAEETASSRLSQESWDVKPACAVSGSCTETKDGLECEIVIDCETGQVDKPPMNKPPVDKPPADKPSVDNENKPLIKNPNQAK